MFRTIVGAATCALAIVQAPPARAEVVQQGDTGFVVRHSAEVPADQMAVWKVLIAPARWWSSDHTWSKDAANLYIDAQATGCFCEKLPKPADAPADQRMGSVEHMHVIFADPQRGLLRMSGALGPLQGEALNGTLTIALKKTDTGTRIELEYVVGGYMRFKGEEIAPAVDGMLSGQLAGLAKAAGG
ncbi:hypothetical protein [Novosphingobium sp.]|uniref:hypothetical protein n=1 Tax=Novosphingobium sp. TaxID=1874826 RepID=UPI0025E3FE1E|nr:hypothetical protein [Novosphingobium sp.]MCC6925974.1 hypothetical protein [Novosphingobium sp.]